MSTEAGKRHFIRVSVVALFLLYTIECLSHRAWFFLSLNNVPGLLSCLYYYYYYCFSSSFVASCTLYIYYSIINQTVYTMNKLLIVILYNILRYIFMSLLVYSMLCDICDHSITIYCTSYYRATIFPVAMHIICFIMTLRP